MFEKLHAVHSPAKFAFRGEELAVSLAVCDEEETLSKIDLFYTVTGDFDGAPAARMLPVDGFLANESYSAYRAMIPASALKGERIFYRFRYGEEESTVYSLPLLDAAPRPPFVLTECLSFCAEICRYLEFYNLTDETIDLYDYELLLHSPERDGRDPLADEPGVNLLPPHRACAVRVFDTGGRNSATFGGVEPAAFFEALSSRFPAECGDIAERDFLCYTVNACQYDEAEKIWKPLGDSFSLRRGDAPYELLLVKKGAPMSEAFFRAPFNQIKGVFDYRRYHAVQFGVDFRDPREAVRLTAYAAPTPGYADARFGFPNPADAVPPVVIPLSPDDRVCLSAGDLAVRFAVLAETVARAAVFVKIGEDYTSFPADYGTDGVFEARIPREVLCRLPGKIEYYISVTGGLYPVTLGTAAAPLSHRVVDNVGPDILSAYPAEGQVITDRTPLIRVSYYDISGVSETLSILCLDGRKAADGVKFGADAVTFRPERPLALGAHVIELSLRDTIGNRTYRKITFEIGDDRELHFYRGQIHSHTMESDGEGTVEEAYTYARDTVGFDFFAPTDHSGYRTTAELARQRAVADSFNVNGSFAALWGWEMTWSHTNGYWGHLNVLNTDWINNDTDHTDLHQLYAALEADENAVAMFNHPGDEWGNFGDFRWRNETIDRRMTLFEIRGAGYDREYALMLTEGWHAAPSYNEDNHEKKWGNASRAAGVVLAPSLTRENIIDAMRKGRTYSTTDRSTEVTFRVNGEWLGARLTAPETLVAEITVRNANELGIGKLELVSEDNITVASVNAGPLREFSWKIDLDPDFDYYYLRITNARQYTVTAPVYIEGRDLLNVTALTYAQCEDTEGHHVVNATVRNDGDKPLTDVTVDFYLSSVQGFELRATMPYESVAVGKLAPGESRTVSARFAEVPRAHRVTALAYGKRGKQRFADTDYILLTPALITKILPLTANVERDGQTVENPYPYVELYNPSPVEVDLKGHFLKLWTYRGRQPFPDNVFTLDGIKIAPHGTVVIWQRAADSPLTAADFNGHYGTSLTEGENLFTTSLHVLSRRPLGRRLDLTRDKEILTRVAYGNFCSHSEDVVCDVPILYAYDPHHTFTERRVGDAAALTVRPGEVTAEQKPARATGFSRTAERPDLSGKSKKQVITRLSRLPLVPLQAAALVAGALTAFKDLFRSEE